MTEFIDIPTLSEVDRFPGLAELLEDLLTPQIARQDAPFDDAQALAVYIEKLTLDLPIEVQELRTESDRFTLGVSPPTQWIETSVEPVWHRVAVTMELDHAESGNQTLES